MKSFAAACVVLGLLTLLYTLLDSPDDQLQIMIREQTSSAQSYGPDADQKKIDEPHPTIPEASANDEAYAFGERCGLTPGLTLETCSTMCLTEFRKSDEYESCKNGTYALMNSMFAAAFSQAEEDGVDPFTDVKAALERANQDELERQASKERKARIEQQAEKERRAKLGHETTSNSEP